MAGAELVDVIDRAVDAVHDLYGENKIEIFLRPVGVGRRRDVCGRISP